MADNRDVFITGSGVKKPINTPEELYLALTEATNLDEIYELINIALESGAITYDEAPGLAEDYAMRIDPLNYLGISDYVSGYTSKDDLASRLVKLDLPEDITNYLQTFVTANVTEEELAVRKARGKAAEAEEDRLLDWKRRNLVYKLQRTADYNTTQQLLNDAINSGTIDRDEADSYLESYKEQSGQYQQGLNANLQALQNSPYLTQADFAKYSTTGQAYAGLAGQPESMFENPALSQTPEQQQRMVLELSNLAYQRQQQQAEIDRLIADVGEIYKTPGFNPARATAPSAGKVAGAYRKTQPAYSQGSRLQQILNQGISRARGETAGARADWASRLREPQTYEGVRGGYLDKMGTLTSFLSTPGLANEVTRNAQRMYRDTQANLRRTTPESVKQWNADMESYSQQDPFKLALRKLNPLKEYYGMTASQRGQNVSRFRPALRF